MTYAKSQRTYLGSTSNTFYMVCCKETVQGSLFKAVRKKYLFIRGSAYKIL